MKTKVASIAPAIVVGLSFLLSRVLYFRAGLHFDNTPPKYYYQFIDPQLLKTRFLESIWYLHSQPPLLNFVTGVLYQVFSPNSKIYQILFVALGFVFALALYWLGIRLGLSRWWSASITIWFMVSPATVLYENLYFYAYPTALLLVIAALALSKFLETENFWWGFAFTASLALLCLTWAIFHLIWMLAVIGLVVFFYRNRRKLVIVSIIPVLIVTGWYTKNYFSFGTFGASSWMGMNLAHVTFLSPLTSQAVRDQLAGLGELTPYPVVEAFRPIENYQGVIAVPKPRGIPVLDEPIKSTKTPNFNHTFYIQLSNRMQQDALRFIRIRPDLYFASVRQGFEIFFHSSSDYLLLKDKPTPKLESFWDRVFYGQLSDYQGEFDNRWSSNWRYIGWWLVVAYIAAIGYGVKTVLNRNPEDRSQIAVITFITFTMLYFTVLANFFDLGENNRFRFTLDPIVFLLFGKLLQEFAFRWKRKRMINQP